MELGAAAVAPAHETVNSLSVMLQLARCQSGVGFMRPKWSWGRLKTDVGASPHAGLCSLTAGCRRMWSHVVQRRIISAM